MKTKFLITGMLLTAVTLLRAATNDLTSALQKGLFEEEANHNLEAAAQAYQAVSARFDQDRKLAATAIFRLGEVYRKQGKPNEATAQYERIVREFADQQTLATLSRQNLAGLGLKSETPLVAGPALAASPEAQELERTEQMLARLSGWDFSQIRKLLPTVVPDAEFERWEAELRRAETGVAGLKFQTVSDEARNNAAIRVAEATDQAMKRYAVILKTLNDRVDMLKAALPKRQSAAVSEGHGATQDAALLQRIKALSLTEARQLLPTLVPDELLTRLLEQYQATEAQRAERAGNYAPEHPEMKSLDNLLKKLDEQIKVRVEGVIKALEIRVAAASAPAGSAGAATQSTTTDDEEKEIRRIQAMIKNSPDLINAPLGDPNLTPLCRAARMAQSRVAEFLLSNGADVNLNRPLSYAAGDGHKAMAELLLRRGAAVNAADSAGQTALHRAAERGFLSVTEALLAAKADPNLRDETARTPLTLAVEYGARPVAAALLAGGADPNIVSRTRKSWGRDRTTEGAPLHFAVVSGSEAMVALLLTNRADLALRNSFGESPLDIAAILGKTAIAAQLLATGAEANGAEPATGASTPLHHAASGGHRDVAKLLLEHGANPNATAVYGQAEVTPLMIAAGNGNTEIVSLLLKHKANPNLLDAEGKTALWNAIYSRKVDVVRLLLANGANPDQPRRDGYPPLVIAIGNLQDKDIAAALLDARADANAKDKSGMTPLHYAVEFNRKDFVELLLAKGADPNVRNNAGRTALDLAKVGLPPGGAIAVIGPGATPVAASARPESGQPLAALLRQHGAVDDLPDFTSIRVTRGTRSSHSVFGKDSAALNRFTLFESLLYYYERGSAGSVAGPQNLVFPDLSRIGIQRSTASKPKERKEIIVNLLTAANGVDCSKDLPLELGDVIEIPEREHTLAEQKVGLTNQQLEELAKCVAKKARFVVRGETAAVTLPASWAYLSSALVHPDVQKILRSSSDLSRVKVKRTDSKTGKTQELLVDAERSQRKWTAEDLWLRDGDVIEVPDKP